MVMNLPGPEYQEIINSIPKSPEAKVVLPRVLLSHIETNIADSKLYIQYLIVFLIRMTLDFIPLLKYYKSAQRCSLMIRGELNIVNKLF